MPLLSDRRAPSATTGRESPDEAGGPAPSIAGSGIPHLRGPHRSSFCCGADIYHPSAHTDEAACVACGRIAETHAVLNSDGEQIWPVPTWFRVPPPVEQTIPRPDPEAWPEPFPVHLPAHLRHYRIPFGN